MSRAKASNPNDKKIVDFDKAKRCLPSFLLPLSTDDGCTSLLELQKRVVMVMLKLGVAFDGFEPITTKKPSDFTLQERIKIEQAMRWLELTDGIKRELKRTA